MIGCIHNRRLWTGMINNDLHHEHYGEEQLFSHIWLWSDVCSNQLAYIRITSFSYIWLWSDICSNQLANNNSSPSVISGYGLMYAVTSSGNWITNGFLTSLSSYLSHHPLSSDLSIKIWGLRHKSIIAHSVTELFFRTVVQGQCFTELNLGPLLKGSVLLWQQCFTELILELCLNDNILLNLI